MAETIIKADHAYTVYFSQQAGQARPVMKTTVIACIQERSAARPSCAGRGGVQLADRLEQALAAQGLAAPVERIACFGRCDEGPNLRIAPGGAFFTGMTPERLDEVVAAVRTALPASGG
ncbi:MAG: (2Fe-2S) ferredoxin domain-containing protein [Magnetococcus sp. DMHC-8]